MIIQATESHFFLLQSGSGSARTGVLEVPVPVDHRANELARVIPSRGFAPTPVSHPLPSPHPRLHTTPLFLYLLPYLSALSLHLHSPLPLMTSLPSLSAFSSLLLPLLPTLFPHLRFSFPSFSSLPLPHPPSRYSRTIEQMAGCLFYMSLWKISSAVDSVTFSKNRHCPTLAECWGNGGGYGGALLSLPAAETLSVCTPHHAFGKRACPRAQRGLFSPAY